MPRLTTGGEEAIAAADRLAGGIAGRGRAAREVTPNELTVWKGAGRRVADGVFVGIEQTSQETRVFVTLFSLSTSLREVIQSPRGESIA